MGTVRQLSNLRLGESNPAGSATGGNRAIRSTKPPAMQLLEQQDPVAELKNMLLSCQNVDEPCPVVALSGNWTHGSNAETNGRSVNTEYKTFKCF